MKNAKGNEGYTLGFLQASKFAAAARWLDGVYVRRGAHKINALQQ